jgi:hypothetical protein
MPNAMVLLFGAFACGTVAGLLAPRWTSVSSWAALAFPLVLPPIGFGLGCLFC